MPSSGSELTDSAPSPIRSDSSLDVRVSGACEMKPRNRSSASRTTRAISWAKSASSTIQSTKPG